MGYTTDFSGEFLVDPVLSPEHREYLTAFSKTRRMKRDETKAAALPDPIREAVGLPVGKDGAYFVGGEGFMGQHTDDSVLDYNSPPGVPSHKELYPNGFSMEAFEAARQKEAQAIADGAQPGLWCQWIPTEDGTAIVWDEGEKFYDYIEWLDYLIRHFLKPWGYTLTGGVEWQGEDPDDRGRILVSDNAITIQHAVTTFVDDTAIPVDPTAWDEVIG